MKQFLLLFPLLTNSLIVKAKIFTHEGQIFQLNAKDSVIQGSDTSFVELKEFTSAGSCPLANGIVRAIIRDNDAGDRQYSLLLSAALSKNEVMLRVDENFKNSEGYCYIMNVRYKF